MPRQSSFVLPVWLSAPAIVLRTACVALHPGNRRSYCLCGPLPRQSFFVLPAWLSSNNLACAVVNRPDDRLRRCGSCALRPMPVGFQFYRLAKTKCDALRQRFSVISPFAFAITTFPRYALCCYAPLSPTLSVPGGDRSQTPVISTLFTHALTSHGPAFLWRPLTLSTAPRASSLLFASPSTKRVACLIRNKT